MPHFQNGAKNIMDGKRSNFFKNFLSLWFWLQANLTRVVFRRPKNAKREFKIQPKVHQIHLLRT